MPATPPSDGSAHAEARSAIENLYYRYADLMDAGDFDAIGALFERAQVVGADGVGVAKGREAVTELYTRATRLYEDGTPKTQHVTTNVIVDLADDGRSASTRARFTVFQALPDFPLQAIIAGHYEDRFAWDETVGWHFVERKMRPTLLGDLSRHLLFDLEAP